MLSSPSPIRNQLITLIRQLVDLRGRCFRSSSLLTSHLSGEVSAQQHCVFLCEAIKKS